MSAEQKPFDMQKWLDERSSLAPKQTVEAKEAFHPGFKEMGLPGHLIFKCPICNVPKAISGEGKFLCDSCGTPLEIKRIA